MGTAVLGAGPAGLTGAYVLGRGARRRVVFEADGVVGGIAKTVEFDGYRFDLGGHRFFTKLDAVARLWEDMLGDEFLLRPAPVAHLLRRASTSPTRCMARDVLARLGVRRVGALRALVLPPRSLSRRGEPHGDVRGLGDARFGRRLYDAFFRSYTEKVWGIPGSEIRAEWAAQRIKDFSLRGRRSSPSLRLQRADATTLIEEFHYPRLGPGPDVGGLPAAASSSAGIEVLLQPSRRRRSTTSTSSRQAVTVEHRRAAGGASRSTRSSRASRSASSCSASTRPRPTRSWHAAQTAPVPLALPGRAR